MRLLEEVVRQQWFPRLPAISSRRDLASPWEIQEWSNSRTPQMGRLDGLKEGVRTLSKDELAAAHAWFD